MYISRWCLGSWSLLWGQGLLIQNFFLMFIEPSVLPSGWVISSRHPLQYFLCFHNPHTEPLHYIITNCKDYIIKPLTCSARFSCPAYWCCTTCSTPFQSQDSFHQVSLKPVISQLREQTNASRSSSLFLKWTSKNSCHALLLFSIFITEE